MTLANSILFFKDFKMFSRLLAQQCMYIMYWPYTALPSVGVSFCTPPDLKKKQPVRHSCKEKM